MEHIALAGDISAVASILLEELKTLQPPAVPDRYLTVDEVADVLKCSPQRVREMIDAGRLPALDVGKGSVRHWRVKESELFKI